ncbi:hypothetical protein GCM10027270_14530 [Nocardioides ginkgobilobae]
MPLGFWGGMVVTVSSLGALGGGRGDRRAESLRSEGVRSGSDLAAAAKEKGVLLRHDSATIPCTAPACARDGRTPTRRARPVRNHPAG